MLDIITKSKIRQRIILLFIYNPNTEFYLSEIAKRVRTSAGTAQRELNKLLKCDFLLFKKRANLNIYVLNHNYPLRDEVESIVKKTTGIEIELKNRLINIDGVEFVFLFGSYVKDGLKSDTNIELFIVGSPDEDRIFHALEEVENVIGREITYHVSNKENFFMRKKDSDFYKDILSHYILLIGNENEFRQLVA